MASTLENALIRFFSDAKYPILFAGAGVSARAGLPTWDGLIGKLAEGIRSVDPMTTQQMHESARDGDYTHAIEYFNLSKKMVQGEKDSLISRLLQGYDIEKIRSVAGLPIKGYVTTNFDRSLLDVLASDRSVSPMDYRFGDISFRNAQWEGGLFVARIHGFIEMPESLVLSDTQFQSLLKDESYADFLNACFVNRNVLFLGFSFYDPAIRHIFNEIDRRFGPATPGRHMVLLPSDAKPEFLQKAHRLNIEVVNYEPADYHAELWRTLEAFVKRKAAEDSKEEVLVAPFDLAKRYMAACYARVNSRSSQALRESVLEGIISAALQEAAPGAITRAEIQEKIRILLGLKKRDTEKAIDTALKSLADENFCRKLKGDGPTKFAWNGEVDGASSLGKAINELAKSTCNRASLQEGWRFDKEMELTIGKIFEYLVRRRGWDLGAAFAVGRVPEAVSLESVIDDAGVSISAYDRERLIRVLTGMFQHPAEDESRLLSELGRVSFALELAFQSPRSILLHRHVLPRKIYFDASVLMPAIVEGHPLGAVYRVVIDKLQEAASRAAIDCKLCVCNVYLNEIISHRRNAEAYFKELGADFGSVARADSIYHGSSNVNVFVGAYANWVERNEIISFDQFLNRFAPYTTEPALRHWLTANGFEVVFASKSTAYSDFYGRLERANASSLARGKTPLLIEHDAIQLSRLDYEIGAGEKVLFVTADKQLAQAVTDSKHASVSESIISHVGLVQYIELMVGGVVDEAGLTELLWSAKVSSKSEAVRSYFTGVGLAQYDATLALAMPSIIERYAEASTKEMERQNADLEADDPKRRATAFRLLGSLEKDYISGMNKEAEKLRRKLE